MQYALVLIFSILYSIILSVGAINALIPVLIILFFIGAAAGIARGWSLFNVFGIGTIAGLGGGQGKGTLANKTFKKDFLGYTQKPLKKTKRNVGVNENKKNEALNKDFNTLFNRGAGAAQLGISGAAIIPGSKTGGKKNSGSKEKNQSDSDSLMKNVGRATYIFSPLVRGSILASTGFINMVVTGKAPKKAKELFYKSKEEELENYNSKYNSTIKDTILGDSLRTVSEQRRAISKLMQKIKTDKNLGAMQKKMKLQEMAMASSLLLKRKKELRDSQNKLNKQIAQYQTRSTEIKKINDPNLRAAEQKKLDESTFSNFKNTYDKLFDTPSDIQATQLADNIINGHKPNTGKYGYKLKIWGGDKEDERLDIIKFNFGRGAGKKTPETNEDEEEEDTKDDTGEKVMNKKEEKQKEQNEETEQKQTTDSDEED